MVREESLILAYLLDGNGGGRKIGWKEIEQWTPEQGILWVHLNYTMNRSKVWLRKHSGLDKLTVRAMVLDESRPRTVISKQGLLIFLRGANLNPGEDPEDMVSIRVSLNQHCVITTRKRKLLTVHDICKAIDDGSGPKSTAEFLVMLNDFLLQRISDVIDKIDDEVDELAENVLSADSRLLRAKIADLRRRAILIRRYLSPQRQALNLLSINENEFLNPLERMYIRESNDLVIKYIEDLDAARERATVTHEELSSRIAERLEKRMFSLSVVASIFLPLSFLTGLLGVNVGGIPGAQFEFAFWIVCFILFCIFIGLSGYFYRKKWI